MSRPFYLSFVESQFVENTSHVPALEDTIAVAGGMLETAAKLDEHSGAIEGLLLSRLKAAR